MSPPRNLNLYRFDFNDSTFTTTYVVACDPAEAYEKVIKCYEGVVSNASMAKFIPSIHVIASVDPEIKDDRLIV